MQIKSQKDFVSGLMFTAIGVAFAIGSTTYTVGEGARMGPGYFPLLLGVVLGVLGLVIVGQSLGTAEGEGERIGAWAWKPLGFVLAANCVFGILLGGIPRLRIPPMGLIVAIYALTYIASLAGDEFDAKEVAILSTVLAAGSYLAFVILLKLQFPVWPTFITG